MTALERLGVHAPPGIEVEVTEDGGTIGWTLANATDRPIDVDRVSIRFAIAQQGELRMFRHGWQSWSESGGAVVGVDRDQTQLGETHGIQRATFHADDAVTAPDELRSELVTVVEDREGATCIGFDGASRHDGTLRVRDGELLAEAYLGGARLAPGEVRRLHDLRAEVGDPPQLLADWAAWAGERSSARTSAPFQVGWCSWYQYFHGVTEDVVRANLARAGDLPLDVFQIDDGYQAAIGDWLRPAPTFPSSLDRLAADIAGAGLRPGLWLAPFVASPDSELARAHPEWLVRRASGRPAIGLVHAEWGGPQHILDVTHPEVLEHLERLASTLVGMGWTYLKLDFTYAPSFTAEWHDPGQTPAQRVRAGYDAIRRGAGDGAFLLGCGAPLGPCIGVVDGMRIGPDVAPHWEPRVDGPYRTTAPSTQNALRNTLARSFQHRRLWLNDPDCLMLRTTDTELSLDQVRAWALAVAASGGMAIISDDLALVDADGRRLLDEVIELGRHVDAGLSPSQASALWGSVAP